MTFNPLRQSQIENMNSTTPEFTAFCRSLIALVIVFVASIGYASDDIFLRLQAGEYDPSSNSVYVDVELKYDGNHAFVLADQNYRLYFDAASLTFDAKKSKSTLPKSLYSNIDIHEIVQGASAGTVDQLEFDEHLGFLNFSINLNSDYSGGVRLKRNEEWKRIAVLRFELEPNQDPAGIVWSRDGFTNKYATAFVQILQWHAPYKTSLAKVSEFYDTSVADNRAPRIGNITLAPNPAIEFVNIKLDNQAVADVNIRILDVVGKPMISETLSRGAINSSIAVDQLAAGTYNVEIHDSATGSLFVESFVKVD